MPLPLPLRFLAAYASSVLAFLFITLFFQFYIFNSFYILKQGVHFVVLIILSDFLHFLVYQYFICCCSCIYSAVEHAFADAVFIDMTFLSVSFDVIHGFKKRQTSDHICYVLIRNSIVALSTG